MRELRAFLQRVDVQMGIAVGGAIALLLVVLMAVHFFVGTHEAVEMEDAELTAELRRIRPHVPEAERDAKQLVDEGIAIRLIEPSGATRAIAGEWPTSGRLFPHTTSSLRLAFAARGDHLVHAIELGDGRRLEGATALADFVGEREEQLHQIAASLAFGLLGVLAVTVFATRRALAPLRAATRAVESVDERNLNARIAVRGSGDDVDRHATALNRVLARLEESFQRVSAFSADVAHELRTPVNQMLNLADVALESNAGAVSPEVVAIREAAEDMRRLIERLLLLAKGDVGRLPLQRQYVSLGDLVRDLAELFQPTCEQRGVALRTSVPAEGAIAPVDAGLVQQALSNLLDNAVRHAPAASEIRFGVAADPTSICVTVSDAGPGVPASERERIFNRFVQVDASRTGSGTGLGLAIARMIARLHGGDVTASASPMGGARFEMRIPRVPSPPRTASGSREAQATPPAPDEEPVMDPVLP